MSKSALHLALVTIIFSATVTTAFGKIDMAAELMRSNILRPDQSISADVHERDATISTYTNRQAAKNKDAVCRLDALLIAKKVTDLQPSIKKVRVWFHEYTGSNYREVVVSADDLKAFESGKLKKAQLLGRLKVRLATSLRPAETFTRKSAVGAPISPASAAVPAVAPEKTGIKSGTEH